jgi:hypothetical protein
MILASFLSATVLNTACTGTWFEGLKLTAMDIGPSCLFFTRQEPNLEFWHREKSICLVGSMQMLITFPSACTTCTLFMHSGFTFTNFIGDKRLHGGFDLPLQVCASEHILILFSSLTGHPECNAREMDAPLPSRPPNRHQCLPNVVVTTISILPQRLHTLSSSCLLRNLCHLVNHDPQS